MMIPLRQFICDTCKQIIENPEDGWVEWLSPYEGSRRISKNFRICHHLGQCQTLGELPDSSHLSLKDVIGGYDHIFILKLIDVGPYHEPKYRGPSIKDFRQYIEFVRRVTLPYYEEARQWWDQAISDGYFGDQNELAIYTKENLIRMIEHYSNQEEQNY